jgi:alkanesulfonate monooxygenase SsuD/methylene tetrahydromethanopterin reductase-like flavin-dependent oxidoreductase (luciferase family)
MCDVAGIDAVWVRDHLAAPDNEPRLEAWTALMLAADAAGRPRIGALLNIAFRPPGTLAAMAGTLDAAVGGRLELSFSGGWVEREHLAFGFDFPDPEVRAARLGRYAGIVAGLLAGEAVPIGGSTEVASAELGVASPQSGGPTIAVEAATVRQMEVAAQVADDVLLPAAAARDVGRAVTMVRQACERAERDPTTLGIGMEVPVSVGRTHAEARARADAEPLFATVGPPGEVGVFGTLEECQERVIGLSHAGIGDLRCILPNAPDVHDVIAQVTAIAVGSPDVLSPGAPKSKAPDPPLGWGGRPWRREGELGEGAPGNGPKGGSGR